MTNEDGISADAPAVAGASSSFIRLQHSPRDIIF